MLSLNEIKFVASRAALVAFSASSDAQLEKDEADFRKVLEDIRNTPSVAPAGAAAGALVKFFEGGPSSATAAKADSAMESDDDVVDDDDADDGDDDDDEFRRQLLLDSPPDGDVHFVEMDADADDGFMSEDSDAMVA